MRQSGTPLSPLLVVAVSPFRTNSPLFLPFLTSITIHLAQSSHPRLHVAPPVVLSALRVERVQVSQSYQSPTKDCCEVDVPQTRCCALALKYTLAPKSHPSPSTTHRLHCRLQTRPETRRPRRRDPDHRRVVICIGGQQFDRFDFDHPSPITFRSCTTNLPSTSFTHTTLHLLHPHHSTPLSCVSPSSRSCRPCSSRLGRLPRPNTRPLFRGRCVDSPSCCPSYHFLFHSLWVSLPSQPCSHSSTHAHPMLWWGRMSSFLFTIPSRTLILACRGKPC